MSRQEKLHELTRVNIYIRRLKVVQTTFSQGTEEWDNLDAILQYLIDRAEALKI